MTDKIQARQNILPSDVDSQCCVTLWDHGPQELKPVPTDTPARTEALKESQERLVAQWEKEHGGVPVQLRMHQADAAHAMSVEPGRYGMEPDGVDEGEVEKRIEEIKAKREAAANSPQAALDRKAAIEAIMSDRRSAASAAAVESTPETSPVPASTAAPVQEVAPPTPESPPWVTPGTEPNT